MENYLLFRILHGLAVLLFFGGLAGLTWQGWRSVRSGDTALIEARLRRTHRLGVPLLSLVVVSLPISGWWMVDMAGLPLAQTWLLGGSILYLFGCIAWLLLVGRLERLHGQILAEVGPCTAQVRHNLVWGASYGLMGLLLFLGVLILMLLKPL